MHRPASVRCLPPLWLASVADPKIFRSGRNFSAWIGLVPKQHSSGGKDRLGSISKQGDRYLRSLFVAGAFAVIRYAKIHALQRTFAAPQQFVRFWTRADNVGFWPAGRSSPTR